jgi:hypothetical protein
MCPIASRHIMPTASCVEYIENAIVRFSIIGPLSSNDRLRWNMRLDKHPLFVAQFSESHCYPLHTLIVRRS